MDDNEKVVLIVSPKVADELLEQDSDVKDALVICMFAPDDTALVVKHDYWTKLVDSGIIFERRG